MAGPLVFFRTIKRNTVRPLRRVLRVDPRTGRRLRSVTLPIDLRSFVDATQVGDRSYLAWTSTRGELWLAEARRSGQISRRWRVDRAGGFDVTPVPEDPLEEDSGTGFLRVTADGRTALLVNGQGQGRFGRYVDLLTGTVITRRLPKGVDENVADIAPLADRFVLISDTATLVTVGARGALIARGHVTLPSRGPREVGFVDLIALPAGRAVTSFTTNRSANDERRRFIARYDTRSGAVTVTRSFTDRFGDTFAATATRFELFGDYPDQWVSGAIDGGPLRQVQPPGPGARPPAVFEIEPEVQGEPAVFNSVTSADGRAFVFRGIDYENRKNQEGYAAYEIVEVDVRTARVLRRTRFADDAGGPSPLPYAFDIRVS